MKILQSVAFVAALGMSSLVGCADPEAPATEEGAAQALEYVAEMTGVT
jgi:hypothetical protein